MGDLKKMKTDMNFLAKFRINEKVLKSIFSQSRQIEFYETISGFSNLFGKEIVVAL